MSVYRTIGPLVLELPWQGGSNEYPQSMFLSNMAYTCLIVLDPEIPFTLPEMKGISGTDGANYKVIK